MLEEPEISMPQEPVDWLHKSPLIFTYKSVCSLPEYLYWRLRGCPGPKVPHRVKERAVRRAGNEFGLRVLVETGTQYGQMINAVRDDFAEVYSIELLEDLYLAARRNFARHPHIHPIWGDSSTALPELLEKLTPPLLFWLDAHSNTSPLLHELDAILRDPSAGNVALIDDAHAFDNGTWSLNPEEIRQWVAHRAPEYSVEVRDNIVHILPQSAPPSHFGTGYSLHSRQP